MASLAAPTPHKLALLVPFSSSPSPLRHHSPSQPFSPHPRVSDSAICRCQSSSSSSSFDSSSSSSLRSWESSLGDAVRAAIQRVDRFFSFRFGNLLDDSPIVADEEPDWDWDWDRWSRHFLEIEEQERLVSVLKPELDELVRSEEFENAARLKVAIAAASTKDVVGRVIHDLNRALEEERYEDAAFIRDNAGSGLVGWWSGIAKESGQARGMVIRITAEHGRYLARRYSPRQLQVGAPGVPLFEIFLRVSKTGEYKQQAVYLKQEWSLNTKKHYLDSTDDLLVTVIEDEDSEKDDVIDPSPESSAWNTALKDTNPGAKVRVLKVTAPGKVDKDLISKVIEQILDEDDEEDDDDIETLDLENGNNEGKSYLDSDMIELEASTGIDEIKERSEIARNVVIGDLIEEARRAKRPTDVVRVPAKLEKDGISSFSFSIEKDASGEDSYDEKVVPISQTKIPKSRAQPRFDDIIVDLSKFIGGEKVPLKVLKDVRELVSHTLGGVLPFPPLSGSTTFKRIESSASSDIFNGLYVGTSGLISEIIHLQRKFGQWKDDNGSTKTNLEFYEYVEAVKVTTGDAYVQAGEVSFRAKIGEGHQLPHRGIIPEEFGVVARYKGEGRLVGTENPPWVEGELVILNGKLIKNGPVVGFIYTEPRVHYLVFLNRLKLQDWN